MAWRRLVAVGRLLPDGIRVECVPLTPETNVRSVPGNATLQRTHFSPFTKDGRVTLSPKMNTFLQHNDLAGATQSQFNSARVSSSSGTGAAAKTWPGRARLGPGPHSPAGVIKSIPSGPGTAPLGIRHARSGPATKWDTRTTAAMSSKRPREHADDDEDCTSGDVPDYNVVCDWFESRGQYAEDGYLEYAIADAEAYIDRELARTGCSTSPTVNVADERCFLRDRTKLEALGAPRRYLARLQELRSEQASNPSDPDLPGRIQACQRLLRETNETKAKWIDIIRKEATEKATKCMQKGKQREEHENQLKVLEEAYTQARKQVAERNKVDDRLLEQVFAHKGGDTAKWWSINRELKHREKWKKDECKVDANDPVRAVYANFVDANGNEIPIHDFVSSNAVSKSRTTEYQAGKIQYHTSDRMPRWGVAPKKENKHHKDRPYNGFVPIQPVPRHLIDMLLAGNAIAKYYKWQDYKAKHSNRIRDAYRDTYRLYKQARGISSKRKLHVERPVPSASAEAALPPAAIYEVRMPNQSASSEDFMVAEELNSFLTIWKNLGLMAGCKKWPATGDWYCEAMILLMESEASRVLLRCKVRRSQRGWLLLPRRVQGPHVVCSHHCARLYARVTLTTCRMPLFQRPTAIASIASTRWPMGPSTKSNPMPPASTAPTWPCRSILPCCAAVIARCTTASTI